MKRYDLHMKGARWMKKWFFIFCSLVLLVACSTSKETSNQEQKPDSSTIYQRPGFNVSSNSGIADPDAITFKTNPQATTYKGEKVIQACSIISKEDLNKIGIKLKPNSLAGPFKRAYFTGNGTNYYYDKNYGMPDNVNSCSYSFNANQLQYMYVFVYQKSYVNPKAIEYQKERYYKAQPEISGVKVYLEEPSIKLKNLKNLKNYLLEYGDVTAYLSIELNDQNQIQKILQTAATNLINQVKQPRGVDHVAYNSPTYSKRFVNSCELLTDSDYKAVFGVDPYPINYEEFATGIGVIKYEVSFKDSTLWNYVEHKCAKESKGSGHIQVLAIDLQAFEETKAAQMEIDFLNQKYKGQQIQGIGDKAIFFNDGPRKNDFFVRKGRFVFRLGMSDFGKSLESHEVSQKLSVVAQNVVQRLNGKD